MLFIHSNKQYIERTMYPINPYMNAPTVAPLTMEAFIAPADFNPDAQELNIVKAFAAYPNANKKYIFSVGTSTTTVLAYTTGRSYAYSQNGGTYTTIVSGTITWNGGSTKRNVVVIDVADTIGFSYIDSSVWYYLSNKITSIGTHFGGNSTLKYIHFQSLNSLISMNSNAFEYCTALIGKVTLPDSYINYSNGGQFAGCTSLTSINFQNSIVHIPRNMFLGCSNITSINIPQSVTSIDYGAFMDCTGLTTIIIPNSVTTIGNVAFNGCINAVFNSDNLILSNLTGSLTGSFKNCEKLKHVDLKNSTITGLNVNSSWQGTFLYCYALISIKLPSTLVTVEDNALRECSNLSLIEIYAVSPPSATSNCFLLINKTTCILHVPVGSLAAYRAAQYWNEFTNIIDDL